MRIRLLAFILMLSTAGKLTAAVIIPVQLVVVNGTYDLSMVTVKKNGESIYSTPGSKNLRLRLENNADYILAFSCPGYITKLIHINTNAPADRLKAGFDPYKIGVRLFRQYEGIETVVYNQPVAYIRYREELDELGYDTDYTKSILSALQPVEELLEKKAAEERESLLILNSKPVIVSRNQPEDDTDVRNTSKSAVTKREPDPSTIKVSASLAGDGNDSVNEKSSVVNGEETLKNNSPVSGDDDKPKREPDAGDNVALATAGSDGRENNPATEVKGGGEDASAEISPLYRNLLRSTEELTERNRTITIIRYNRGKEVTEFRSVHYNSGETYFFMNGRTAISQHLFRYFTGERM